MRSEVGEIGKDWGRPTSCLLTQQGQGPKASCVHSSPPWVRTREKARRDRRPRTAGLGVGSPEVVGLEHGWERGAGSRPGPWACHKMEAKGRKWKPGGKGEQQGPGKGLSGPGGQVLKPQHCSHSPWPPGPKSHPRNNPHQPIHQAQEGRPTPESHV